MACRGISTGTQDPCHLALTDSSNNYATRDHSHRKRASCPAKPESAPGRDLKACRKARQLTSLSFLAQISQFLQSMHSHRYLFTSFIIKGLISKQLG